MRVLLVNPPLTPGGAVQPPVGLAALGAWLHSEGHSVQILDLDLEQRLAGKVQWPYACTCLDARMREFAPDVCGFTSMFSNSLFAARLIARAKAWNDGVVTVAGGSHFGALATDSLAYIPELDFAVRGEGETAFADLLQALDGRKDLAQVSGVARRERGTVLESKPGDLLNLAELPSPWNAELFELHRYVSTDAGDRVAYLEVGRGCPFACTFCATAPFWRRKYRVKTEYQVVDELSALVDAGYERFIFVHDLLTVDRSYVKRLCEAIRESRLPVQWMANSRTDLSLEGLLPTMKLAGCWKLFFGIESASTRVQNSTTKRLDPMEATVAIVDLVAHGMTATCSFVIGFPDEARSEASESVRLAARMKLLGAEIVQFHRLRIWPPAPLSLLDVPHSFDSLSLDIEHPYLAATLEERAEIEACPKFYPGYFSPDSTLGSPSEVSQLEMFAHHAVGLAPLTIFMAETMCPGVILDSVFKGAANRELQRDQFDWDGGRMDKTWAALTPILEAIVAAVAEEKPADARVLREVLGYERHRLQFTTDPSSRSMEFGCAVNIPLLLDQIRSGSALCLERLLQAIEVKLQRSDTGTLSAYWAATASV
ncbi:MAG: cobalamin-dependent protein [Proteobacteria bacterium]|nr:cobalamin-dependent protein [Pseudomonadota bacterium]